MLENKKINGRITYTWLSLHITTTTKLQQNTTHLKFCVAKSAILGPELLKEMELIVKRVQGNLKVAQDKKKSQADLKQTQKDFQVGEHVFIKVRPKKSSLRLGSCAKLAPRYCGTFEILSRMGQVAY